MNLKPMEPNQASHSRRRGGMTRAFVTAGWGRVRSTTLGWAQS